MSDNETMNPQDNGSNADHEYTELQNNTHDNDTIQQTQNMQSPYQQNVQMPYGNNQQNAQSPYSPDYMQQPYQSPYVSVPGQPTAENIPVKKKGKKVLVAVLIVFAVIAVGIGSAFVFANDYMTNLVARYFKSDSDYFLWVERNNFEPFEDQTEKQNAALAELTRLFENGFSANSDISVKIGGFIAEKLGVEGLGRIGMKQDVTYKDKAVDTDITLKYNDVDIMTLEMLLDFMQEKGYLRIPEYSETYLDMSALLKDESGQSLFSIFKSMPEMLNASMNANSFTADYLNELVEKYYFSMIEQIEKVEVSSSEKFIIGEEELTCSKISLDLDINTIKTIVKYELGVLKSDDKMLDYIVSQMNGLLTKEQLVAGIDEALVEIDGAAMEEINASIDIYVNRTGEIIGRNFAAKVQNTPVSFVYGNFSEGDDINYNAAVKAAGFTIVNLTSKGTTTDGKTNGRLTIDVPAASLILGTDSAKMAMYVDYNDIVNEPENISGKIKITVDAPETADMLDGISISDLGLLLNYSIQKKVVDCSLVIMQGEEEILNAALKSAFDENAGTISTPGDADEVIDASDSNALTGYIDIAKAFEFLQNVSDRANDPFIDELIQSLLGSYATINTGTVEPVPEDDPGVDPEAEPEVTDVDISKNYYYSKEYLSSFIEIGEYKGVKVAAIDNTVTDEELASYIEQMLYNDSKATDVTEGGIEQDDAVSADVAFSIDGTELTDYNQEDYYMTIGYDSLLDGVDDQLMGKNTGDILEIPVTLNEEYGDYAGKEAVANLTIKSVTRYIQPEYNEEYATGKGYTSIDEYEKALEEELLESKESGNKQTYIQKIIDSIYENSTVKELTPEIMNVVTDTLKAQFQTYADMLGMDIYDMVESTYGYSKEEFDAMLLEQAKVSIKSYLVIAAVIEKEGLFFTGNEYAEVINSILPSMGYTSYGEILETYQEQELVDALLEENVMESLYNNAIINE